MKKYEYFDIHSIEVHQRITFEHDLITLCSPSREVPYTAVHGEVMAKIQITVWIG